MHTLLVVEYERVVQRTEATREYTEDRVQSSTRVVCILLVVGGICLFDVMTLQTRDRLHRETVSRSVTRQSARPRSRTRLVGIQKFGTLELVLQARVVN